MTEPEKKVAKPVDTQVIQITNDPVEFVAWIDQLPVGYALTESEAQERMKQAEQLHQSENPSSTEASASDLSEP